VYRGKVEPEPSFFKIALYISFFPQLIADPVFTHVDQYVCARVADRDDRLLRPDYFDRGPWGDSRPATSPGRGGLPVEGCILAIIAIDHTLGSARFGLSLSPR
jgi:hypothetical protein